MHGYFLQRREEGFAGDKLSGSGRMVFTFHLPNEPMTKRFVSSLCLKCFLDIDECSFGSHKCDVNAYCTNTVGSHSCSCKEGFIGDGRSCSRSSSSTTLGEVHDRVLSFPLVIVDIDKCSYGSHKCDLNSYCTNTFSSSV